MTVVFMFQIAIHLAEKGYRVFAGLRAGEESLAGRLARGWAVRREGSLLVPLELDVTREDILHEAAVEVTKHLPAGENGKFNQYSENSRTSEKSMKN